jgi:aspartate beta-hydroxylase
MAHQVHSQALAALAKGEAAQARDLIEPLIASGLADVATWLALAQARAMLGDGTGAGAAIEEALKLAPNDLAILLAKADHLASEGDARGAAAFYGAALRYVPQMERLPPQLQEGLRRAQAANAALARELEDVVRARLDEQGLGGANAPRRFAAAVDLLFGRRRVYVQAPQYLYYPGLPQIEFYERENFSWLDSIEAETATIRDELKRVVGAEFRPYVTQAPGRPTSAQMGMLNNPSWSAFFMRKDGADVPGAERCSRTMAALATAPLTNIPARAPSILFSKLAAGAHIPAHNGMLNARLICHLPLVVPEGCTFRVGGEVRAWVEGKAWVFDDTIEHEAWNRGGEDRYVLLFDIWRPELSEEERFGVATLCEAIDAYRGKSAWNV